MFLKQGCRSESPAAHLVSPSATLRSGTCEQLCIVFLMLAVMVSCAAALDAVEGV